MCFWFNIKNKGIRREKHVTTAACPQKKVEQEHIKSSILLDTINFQTK
jgi:hypothetical protein